ncbi:unnamed protein product, partial [marine sediment metagenome]
LPKAPPTSISPVSSCTKDRPVPLRTPDRFTVEVRNDDDLAAGKQRGSVPYGKGAWSDQ